MFQAIQPAPPDAILGLTEAFRADPRETKINLAVGVYKDASGRTPVFAAVKAAEARLLERETTKSYLPIEGPPAYGRAVRRLLFGADQPAVSDGTALSAATPGGTGGLRVAADYLHQNHPDATVWLSSPTWANHPHIFAAAGVPTRPYPYLDATGFALDFRAMLDALKNVPVGDVVLLHGCCHNPTGVDPSTQQWMQIAEVLKRTGALPLLDFAYQGFGEGVEEDAAGLRAVVEAGNEALICSSFSKTFGLYNERVAALTVLAGSPDAASAVMTRLKQSIRRNYSNPPAHGLSVVQTVLDDAALAEQWATELAGMRQRIHAMRSGVEEGLDRRGVKLAPDGNAFITAQNGMFTMSGLPAHAVQQLRDDHAIYVVGDGRINVAGITPDNMDTLCDAIAAVAGS